MLYLRTFGGLTLENGGESVTGAGAQRSRLALLAVLAAAGDRGISRDSLLAIFWPESDTEQARGALKQALYALRRDLGGPELISGNGNLMLNPSIVRSDVEEFSRALKDGELERAVALYRGKFLEGVHLNGGEFDRWLDRQQQHYDGLCQDALTRLAKVAEARSDFPEAVRWRLALAAADPLSGPVAVALMRTLVKTGDSAAALRHARVYQQMVKSELDAPPDQSVLDLVAEISQGSPRPPASIPPQEPASPQLGDPPGGPAEHENARSRRWLAVGSALAALGGLVWVFAAGNRRQPLDADRVVLIASPRDSALLAELIRGLPERDPTLKVAAAGIAGGAGARYTVQVSSAAEGDSVRFSAAVTDAASGTIPGAIESVVTHFGASADGARVLRDRVAVALAAGRNPLFANWAHAARLPYTWDAFEQMTLGIQAFTTGSAIANARTHFQTAAELDSTSGAPLLWEAFVLQESASRAESDSILTAVERSARRFGPWERALAAVLRARNQHDLPGAHAAGHRLLEVVPGSEWALLVARDALGLGRAREAAELSEAVSRNPGWSKDWWLAVITRDQAYHSLGDYRQELDIVRQALRRDPDSRLWLQSEVKALAGLGRVSEVMTTCQRALATRPEPDRVEWMPCDQALLELAAHGHMDSARSLALRLLPAREKEAAGAATGGALARAATFATLADWAEVDRALRAVPSSEAGDRGYLELLALAQAFRGDRAGAGETVRRIDSLTAIDGEPYAGGDSYHHAGVAALLGDREAAIDLLEKAFREGFGRIPLHWAGPLDGLRGYPRFDALARPIEDRDHLARFARR